MWIRWGGRAEDAFDLVIPDAPGYGFSQPLTRPGWTNTRVAQAYDQLMRSLGYDRYGDERVPPTDGRENARAQAEPEVNPAPTGVAVFKDDFQTIRVFADRDNDRIVHWSRFELVAGDVRTFFASLR